MPDDIEAHDDSANLATIDLATSDDPRAMAQMLRAEPVFTITDDMLALTRRSDIEAALRNPGVFSSAGEAINLGNIRPLIPLQIDPPKHVKYRRILDPLFAPRHMAALEGEVVALVGDLLDEFAASGRCDLHEQFAVPLPCTVFLRLLGLPLEDIDQFLDMKEGIIRPPGDSMEEQEPYRRKAADDIYRYFSKVVDERHRNPGDDLMAKIMSAEIDGQRLTDDEVLDVCFLFMIAGLDTVTDSLDCMFAYLAQNDEHRRQVVKDESIIASTVEELLRWESPVPAVARIAAEDTEVGGCPIKGGTHVMLLIGSANTDDADHTGSDEVDLARNPNPHLAFGGGVHRCLGSHLARIELRVALREFHRRIPEYQLAPGTVLQYTAGLRSLHTLPLVFPLAT
jgi:cytochrome P450